jgi:hypothetical protein
MREDNRITIISDQESLKATTVSVASSWQERLKSARDANESKPSLSQAV